MPIEIDGIEVHLDFHIFAILEFDILIGYPLENLFQEKPSHGSLNEEFGKIASASYPEIPMAKHHPSHYLFEEVKFISPLVSPRLSSETEHPPSPSLEPKPCPSGQNLCAMDNLGAPTLELKKNDSTNEHEGFSFETPRVSCSLLESPELIMLSATCFYEDHDHLLVLVHKLFRTLVVDAYVY